MRANRLMKVTADGRVAVGLGLSFNTPDLVEFAGLLGFDFVFFDGEHGGVTAEMCRELQRAADVVGVETIVRVPHNDGPTIGHYLDVGVWNLIVPHVRSASDAEAAVRAAAFAPRGGRGAGSGTRAARFGLTQTPVEYFERANEQVVILPMIEDIDALAALNDIARVEGIRAAFVGAQDLSLSMGKPGRTVDPDVRAAADRAIRGLRAAGLVVGAPAGDSEEARRVIDLGAQLIVVFTPTLLAREARRYLEAVRTSLVR
jgi:2-keto-3-deoxy-L-rhamnonate aldolase RhmA